LDDISIFVANWQTKSENLRTIARALGIGLDAMAFVDDNEVERAAVRQQVPEVSVVPMPGDPCRYVDALSEYLGFETAIWTRDDRQRTQQYQARAQAAELEQSSGSMEDFLRGLAMQALVRPFDELHLPRIEQLIGKTNQFNLTTRRYGLPQLRAMMEDPQCVHLYLRLRDRFTDHGLVAVLIGSIRAEILEIDTWLMSCRVLGRTVEAEMLRQVCRLAAERHCHTIRGIYIPTPKNEPARDVYARFNFAREAEIDGAVFWTYDLRTKPPIRSEFITVATNWESQDECARAIGVAVSQRVS
ncbi:MAG: HAD-IIIC family phosphatase, partial [Pirellulaceae bacterium]